MRTWLSTGDRRRTVRPEGPACDAFPFQVAGTGRWIESRDTYAAHGYCVACRAHVGTLRARVETLFGLEEDEAVLVRGRARVY